MRKIVGIDEVGRGPLAGPVSVCVLACDIKTYLKLRRDKRLPPSGKDSKKLSALARQKYAKFLKNHIGLTYVVVHISNKLIDEKGISFCVKKAVENGIKKLKLNPIKCQILLDGGLKAPEKFKKQKTIIRGDEKEKIIAWASILAKVSRDTFMCRMAKKFPIYGFEANKGYGTAKHRLVIRRNGLSIFHRRSFCGKVIGVMR